MSGGPPSGPLAWSFPTGDADSLTEYVHSTHVQVRQFGRVTQEQVPHFSAFASSFRAWQETNESDRGSGSP